MVEDQLQDEYDLPALSESSEKSGRRITLDQASYCGLLALAPEVRDCIWMHCHLEIPVTTVLTAKSGLRLRTSRKHESLRLTCRQINIETQRYRATPKFRGAPKCSDNAPWILKLPSIEDGGFPEVVNRLTQSKQAHILRRATRLVFPCSFRSFSTPPFGLRKIWLKLIELLPRLQRIEMSCWNPASPFIAHHAERRYIDLRIDGNMRELLYEDYLRDFPLGDYDSHYDSAGTFVADILYSHCGQSLEIHLEASQSFTRQGKHCGQIVPIGSLETGCHDIEPVNHMDIVEFIILTDGTRPIVKSRKRRSLPRWNEPIDL